LSFSITEETCLVMKPAPIIDSPRELKKTGFEFSTP
jgi:hypothetical protein